MARKLEVLASIINTKQIEVSFVALSERDRGELAHVPDSFCGDFVVKASPLTAVQKQSFRSTIFINHAWNTAPLYWAFFVERFRTGR